MINIRKGTIEEAVSLSDQIPEFDNPYRAKEYEQRLKDADHSILVAEVDNVMAGFKVGYDKYGDGSFYTWMGGVIPDQRRKGIAKQLADHQEKHLKDKGYRRVIIKTRNCHQNMLMFTISNGFKIMKVIISKDNIDQNRIELCKEL